MEKIIACATMNNFILGGGETYIIRMLKWGKENGYRPYLFIEESMKILECWEDSFKDINIIRFKYTPVGVKLLCGEEEKKYVCNNCELIITQRMHSYLHFRNSLVFKSAKVIFYVVLPVLTTPIPVLLLNKIYKKVIDSEIDNGIVFMDEECSKYAMNSYHLKSKPKDYYRIGNFIKKIAEENIYKRACIHNQRIVLTSILRFSFPQKSYILGVLDDLVSLDGRGKKLEINIVGNGDGKDEIEKHIERLPNEIRDRIKLLGNVPYDELQAIYNRSTIYVGMGTTLLEAANEGLPAIVATAYNEKGYSTGVFAENPYNLGGNLSLSNKKYKIIDIVNNIIKMEEDNYIALCKKCHESVAKEYSIDITMKKMLSITNVEKKWGNILCIIDYVFAELKIFKDNFIDSRGREKMKKAI